MDIPSSSTKAVIFCGSALATGMSSSMVRTNEPAAAPVTVSPSKSVAVSTPDRSMLASEPPADTSAVFSTPGSCGPTWSN